MTLTRTQTIVLGVLAFAALWFFNIGRLRLIDPDEGRYAEMAREMATTGDYVTPRLNGLKYFEKPPLHMWVTALALRAFGTSEASARLWTVASGCLTALAVFAYLAFAFDLVLATLAAAVLASSPLFIALGHLGTLDTGLTFFMTLTLLSCVELTRDHGPRRRKVACLVLWASLAGALLTKGLVALVLPGGVAVLHTLWTRDFGLIRRTLWLPAIVLFVVLAVPWFVLVEMRNPGFAHFFFIHEHFERYATDSHARKGPLWYFVPVLLLTFLPWLLALGRKPSIARLRTLWTETPQRFLFLWATLIFAFFSASSSKLIPYILPVLPAIAILVATRVRTRGDRGITGAWLGFSFLPFVLFAASFAGPYLPKDLAAHAQPELLVNLRIVSAASLVLLGLFWTRRRRWAPAGVFVGLAMTGLVTLQLDLWIFGETSARLSAADMGRAIRPFTTRADEVYIVHAYRQSLPFYIDRVMKIVWCQGEQGFGCYAEPERVLADAPALLEELKTKTRAVIVLPKPLPTEFTSLADLGPTIYTDRTHSVAVRGFSEDEISASR